MTGLLSKRDVSATATISGLCSELVRPESDIFDVYNERDMECFFEKILNWILRRRWFPGMQHALDQC